MNYDKLAQRVVALGVGYRIDMTEPHSGTAWGIFGHDFAFLTAESFCNDGRVVLAMMEKARAGSWLPSGRGPWHSVVCGHSANHDSLAVSILTACCDALEA